MELPRLRLVVAAASAVTCGLLMSTALPVAATTTGPNVVAVHRNGAVDGPGGGFAPVAKMTLPVGNWTITATATPQGTDVVSAAECFLQAGQEGYDTRSTPNATGPGSLVSIELLLAHHFAKSGTVYLNCFNSGSTGDVLICDVHIVAIQIGQLTDQVGSFGTGSPRAVYHYDPSLRMYASTATFDVQDMTLQPGTWFIQATAWGDSICQRRPGRLLHRNLFADRRSIHRRFRKCASRGCA